MTFELRDPPLLSRTMLERPIDLRGDGAALDAGWPHARVLHVSPRGKVRMAGAQLLFEPSHGPRPADAVLLGVEDGVHVWAVRDERFDDRTVPGESDGSVEFGDLRRFGADLSPVQAAQYTTAVAVLTWHLNAGFCARDGAKTTVTQAGWVRACSKCGREEYPRTDPAVICLVHDGADRVLLARQPVWPERMFSILAGFVEAGESLETCVAREIAEEVGVHVRDVRYLGSQPWPFPRSIMLGFHAVGDPDEEFAFTDGEIGEARWFTREQVRAALTAGDWSSADGGELLLPGSISIARGMVEAWAAG